MLTIHLLESSRSFRIVWLLEELGLSYQIKHHRRNAEASTADTSLHDIHPLGVAPVLNDNGLTLIESGAIIEYLLNHYDRSGLRPPIASADYNQYSMWMHFAEGSLMPALSKHQALLKMGTTRVPFFARSILKKAVNGTINANVVPEIEKKLNFIDTELGQHGWFCGSQFTAADIQMCYPLELAEARGCITADMQNIQSFLSAVQERPAYRIAKEKSGHLTLSLDHSVAEQHETDDNNDAKNGSADLNQANNNNPENTHDQEDQQAEKSSADSKN